jgi:sporulation protein YlmC with PRC-barrel domain
MPKITLKQIFLSIIIINFIFFLPLFSWAEEASNLIPASKWIDREIYSKTGNQIGEIDDLVIRRSGKIKKVTIDVGGFLGIGDKLVAVSPDDFGDLMVKANGRMVLDTTEQQIEKRPEFDYYRKGLLPDYYYRPKHYYRYGYYAFPPPYPPYEPSGPQSSERPAAPFWQGEPYDWAFSPARFLASTLMNRQVINESGNYIGRVADLLIDTRDERVKKIILASESIRGDDALVAIPYEPPGFAAYGVVFDISRKEIKNLPAYHIE